MGTNSKGGKEVRSDFTGDEIKDNVRLGHLAEATRMPYLWDSKRNHLRCDWLELCGEDAPTARHLFDLKMVGAAQKFIGWDLNTAAIERCEQTYLSEIATGQAQFSAGDLLTAMRNDEKSLRGVGVLVWDQTKAASAHFTESEFPIIARFANLQRERLGEFLLILAVSDPPMAKTSLREGLIHSLGEMVGATFGACAVPPEKFATYRGETSSVQMYVLRLRLL